MSLGCVWTFWHLSFCLQVMVWIHGGGLVVGSASMNDVSELAATEELIIVTIQYRLGILGFFR